MYSDRELLELAAKAAGIEGIRYSDGFGCMAHWNESDGGWFDACGLWDPLTDDGDALRLAMVLGLGIEWQHDSGYVKVYRTKPCGVWNVHITELFCVGDAMVATRRAIVRAAASIGEAM